MQAKKVIIDCDPGIDDAAAILMAINSSELEIVGITTVAGNAPLETTTNNALKIVELSGAINVPVYRGSEKPLRQTLGDYEDTFIYSKDALGDIHLPQPAIKAKEGAVDFILEALEKTEKLSIISIGPMTNLARAAMKNPEVFCKVDGIYSMGGAVLAGNVTAVAEFNYWADPEAAEIVYKSGAKIHMLGLNVTEKVLFRAEHQQRLIKGNLVTQALGKMLEAPLNFEESHTDKRKVAMHDVLAVAACVSSELFEWVDCHVEISTTKVTRGECIADIVDAWGQTKNCCLAVNVDSNKLMEGFFHTVLPGTDVVKVI